jgi:hypothetical protein
VYWASPGGCSHHAMWRVSTKVRDSHEIASGRWRFQVRASGLAWDCGVEFAWPDVVTTRKIHRLSAPMLALHVRPSVAGFGHRYLQEDKGGRTRISHSDLATSIR